MVLSICPSRIFNLQELLTFPSKKDGWIQTPRVIIQQACVEGVTSARHRTGLGGPSLSGGQIGT